MKIFLGIDGGGSKTEAAAAAEDGRIYGWGKTGPSNPLFLQPSQALDNMLEAAGAVFSQAGIDRREIAYTCICIPGFIKTFPEDKVANSLQIERKKISIMGDERSTMLAALGSEPGVVIAAGTGSFAIGRDEHNKVISAGGWGPILGDEGSGYDVGKQALRVVIAEHERRGEKTLLTETICELWKIEKVEDIRLFLSSHTNFQQTISALAPLVLECAEEGDAAAQNIIKQAGESLADLVKIVVTKLNLQGKEIPVVLTGGMSNFGNWINPFITGKLKDIYKINAVLQRPKFSTVIGAVLLAMQKAAFFPDEKTLIKLKENYDMVSGVKNGTSK